MDAKQEIKELWQLVCDAGQFTGRVVCHKDGHFSLYFHNDMQGRSYLAASGPSAYILGYLQGRIDGEGT